MMPSLIPRLCTLLSQTIATVQEELSFSLSVMISVMSYICTKYRPYANQFPSVRVYGSFTRLPEYFRKQEYTVRVAEAAMAILQLETLGTEGSQALSLAVVCIIDICTVLPNCNSKTGDKLHLHVGS